MVPELREFRTLTCMICSPQHSMPILLAQGVDFIFLNCQVTRVAGTRPIMFQFWKLQHELVPGWITGEHISMRSHEYPVTALRSKKHWSKLRAINRNPLWKVRMSSRLFVVFCIFFMRQAMVMQNNTNSIKFQPTKWQLSHHFIFRLAKGEYLSVLLVHGHRWMRGTGCERELNPSLSLS